VGLGGADSLFGLQGDDDLTARDGLADVAIDCDGDQDIGRYDVGLDPDPIDCETLNPR
jgi:hypothetical protein